MKEPSRFDRLWLLALVAVAAGGAVAAPLDLKPASITAWTEPQLRAFVTTAGDALRRVPGVAELRLVERAGPTLVVVIDGSRPGPDVKADLETSVPQALDLKAQLRYAAYARRLR